jgi:hypothetical protein
MKIHIEIQDDNPSAYPLERFEVDQIQLLPQIGDQITNGLTTRHITGRVFQYGEDEITLTLICGY